MNNLQIIILAAGKGIRMKSTLPKVLHCIGGKTMIEKVVETSLQLNPSNINIVIGFKAEAIKKKIIYPVNFIYQENQLGTAHAVKCALPFIKDTGSSLILYADVPLINLATLQNFIQETQDALGILIAQLENPTGYGRIIYENNSIKIVEEKDASDQQKKIKLINTGIMLIPNKFINKWINLIDNNNSQNEYYLTDIIALANKDNYPIKLVTVKDQYIITGINDKIQLSNLERIYQNNIANNFMQRGLTLLDPSRFDLRGDLTFGHDCIIDVNVIFKGKCKLGNNVKIGANCVLKDVVIDDNSIINDFSHIEGCKIGINSQIGPFSRIRPDTTLGNNTKIGNFVEVKKSIIGNNNKINHLSYIGDTTMQENNNIGAGTVTCNYDGYKKNSTIIGNNCFIGSGTMIVSPIIIEDNVTIGAGSVITHNCPADQLSLSRSKQVVIPNWKRKTKND